MLEADKEFMDIVKAVDSALGSAGMTYESMIDMFENKQTGQWCERIYNRDAQLKYINPYNTGVYDEGLFSLQGTRNSHRRWWLSQRFNIYDAKFITGSFKTQNIWFKLNGAPIGSYFDVTSGKYLPFGYEITNGASEVTGFIPVNDTYRFVIPQGVSVGDPVLIYGATNIKKLDMSNVVKYLSQISLAGAYSDSVGTMLEELDLHGENEASNVTISGLEYLTSLKTFNVRGVKGIKEINLPNSLNIKSLYARGSGLSSVNLAPGCLIEELELPDDVQTLNLIDLPLLKETGLIINGGWSNVSDICISNCPNLTNDFDLIWRWYDNTRHLEVRNVELYGVKWTNVNIDRLLELARNTNITIKGKIGLQSVADEDKDKLLELERLFDGQNIFDENSDLHIYGPTSIYIFGPEDGLIYEGTNFQFKTIVFSENPGSYRYIVRPVDGDDLREGISIDEQTGKLTTTELGLPDLDVQVTVLFIISDSLRFTNSETVTIKKKIYPQNVQIIGKSEISDEPITYTWKSFTTNITGEFSVEWSLVGNIDQYISIINSGTNSCTLEMHTPPETVARGTLQLTLTK